MLTRLAMWCLASALVTLVTPVAAFIARAGGSAPECVALHGVLIEDGTRERLILQPVYAGDGASFAWVIPVPAAPSSSDAIPLGEDALKALDDTTSPLIKYYVETRQPSCACGPFSLPVSDGTERIEPIGGTPPWASSDKDAYRVRVLTATESTNVGDTLTQAGYADASQEHSALAGCAAEGWRFVLVEVDGESAFAGAPRAAGGRVDSTLLPVSVTFESPTALLPLRSLVPASGSADVILTAVAPGRVAADGASTIDMDTSGLNDTTDASGAYQARLRQLVGEGPGQAWVVEHSGELRYDVASSLGLPQSPTRWVTRLHSIVNTGAPSADLQLVSAPTNAALETVIYQRVVRTGSIPWPGGVVLALALLGPRRRRAMALLAGLLLTLCCS